MMDRRRFLLTSLAGVLGAPLDADAMTHPDRLLASRLRSMLPIVYT
jgi:hypothetical protein